MTKKERLLIDATKAFNFDAKARVGGGNKLSHKPCSYGIALKWLVHAKGMTYFQFAQRYNGTTGQNINHLINRCAKERFFEEDIEKMCTVLGVKQSYFYELCQNIEEMLEK